MREAHIFKGFTLTELLVAFAVLALIVLALNQVITSIVKTGLSLGPQRNVQQAGRTAMDLMVRELRYAGRVHGNPAPFSVPTSTKPVIVEAWQHRIRFRGIIRDVNGDGEIDFYTAFYDTTTWSPLNPDAEDITFKLLGDKLVRSYKYNSGGSWSTYQERSVIDIPEARFTNLDFEYSLKGSISTVTSVTGDDRLDITHIDISLTTEDTHGREKFTIKSTVRPRELTEKIE